MDVLRAVNDGLVDDTATIQLAAGWLNYWFGSVFEDPWEGLTLGTASVTVGLFKPAEDDWCGPEGGSEGGCRFGPAIFWPYGTVWEAVFLWALWRRPPGRFLGRGPPHPRTNPRPKWGARARRRRPDGRPLARLPTVPRPRRRAAPCAGRTPPG